MGLSARTGSGLGERARTGSGLGERARTGSGLGERALCWNPGMATPTLESFGRLETGGGGGGGGDAERPVNCGEGPPTGMPANLFLDSLTLPPVGLDSTGSIFCCEKRLARFETPPSLLVWLRPV